MRRVTGIGGVFFKSRDPAALRAWYATHLGIEAASEGAAFQWRDEANPDGTGMTIWCPFPETTRYFEPSSAPFMINYRVENLDALIDLLRAEGVEIDPKRDDAEYGRFAWIFDPEGNKIELWEPPAGS